MNRRSNDIPRADFTVRELVNLTLEFYRRNYIEGLFLSSGVYPSQDDTMEKMLLVAHQLRQRQFGGYIHLKAIPGASIDLISRAGLLADRLSVNIELPSSLSLNRLAPQKSKQDILKPMQYIGEHWSADRDEMTKKKRGERFCPAGHSTQMIVGASPETDHDILHLTSSLYRKYSLKRVYYSAYMPVGRPSLAPTDTDRRLLVREHRLYQADWLMRQYGFAVDELSDQDENLDLTLDPKSSWALKNPSFFPVEVNRASRSQLLRVPGMGPKSVLRIIQSRRMSAIHEEHLERIGVIMKRAKHFITCNGKKPGGHSEQRSTVYRDLLSKGKLKAGNAEQLTLFPATAT